MTKRIAPVDVRFIKLGRNGEWEGSSIEVDQVIRLGYRSPLHKESLAGDWDELTRHWRLERKGNNGTAKNDVRQIRDFYECPPTTLWFTFYRRHLWWCFAKTKVQILDDESRVRAVKGRWQSTDLEGRALTIETLDGRLVKVGMYRGTICAVSADVSAYLARKINGELPQEVLRAQDAMQHLQVAVGDLIQGLFWKDFELLADLMFARAGYQRVHVLGQTEKGIDLDLEAPVTGRRAFVQVKSTATRRTLDDSIAQYREMPQYDEFFFVCHTGFAGGAELEEPDVHVVTGPALAKLVIHAGLVDWLVGKRS